MALVRTDISEERITFIIRVTRIGDLGITLAVNRNRRARKEILCFSVPLRSSETLVLTRATLRNIPEDSIPHSHRRENLKSYIKLTGFAG
jgi:hypothetical protein